ncbi:MAG: 50S ribosomal protein L3 [Planctomycetota bacterium]|jgi:large subunit ribosomal protein L3
MSVALYGTKVGMTRVFDGDVAVPVTVIQVDPNEVVEIKSADKHGYAALKVACGPKKRKLSKSVSGEFKKADVAPRRFLREIPLVDGVEVGGRVGVDVLTAETNCDVTATSKGRGFAGVMKRYNFAGGPATHGSQFHRRPGSIGCRMDPGKVFKNKKMPGHYGVEQVTVRNLSIVKVDIENNLVLIKGAVPGPNGGLVSIRQA